jgi:hypothetical protein
VVTMTKVLNLAETLPESQQNAPPLPGPRLLPASGGEGEALRNRAFLDLCRCQWGGVPGIGDVLPGGHLLKPPATPTLRLPRGLGAASALGRRLVFVSRIVPHNGQSVASEVQQFSLWTRSGRRVRAPGLQAGGFVGDVGRVPSPGGDWEGHNENWCPNRPPHRPHSHWRRDRAQSWFAPKWRDQFVFRTFLPPFPASKTQGPFPRDERFPPLTSPGGRSTCTQGV